MSSGLRGSDARPVRREHLLDAALGERDILGGHDTPATTQHGAERGAGLVLPHPVPSLFAQIPGYGPSAPRHRYLGESLVDTGKHGGVAEVADRPRGEVVGANCRRRGEAVVEPRNGGEEAGGVGHES